MCSRPVLQVRYPNLGSTSGKSWGIPQLSDRPGGADYNPVHDASVHDPQKPMWTGCSHLRGLPASIADRSDPTNDAHLVEFPSTKEEIDALLEPDFTYPEPGERPCAG